LKPKRSVRLAEEILKELSIILIEKLGDPRLQNLTFTHVKLTDDLRIAKVYFSVLGGEQKIKDAEMGLNSAKGFLKREIALRMSLRYVPDLLFFYDETLEYGNRIEQALTKITDEKNSIS
jgi:ribosome-binding factor A